MAKKSDFDAFKEISDNNTKTGIRASLNQLLDVQTVRQGGTVKVGVDHNTAQDLMQMVVNGAKKFHVCLYVVAVDEFDAAKKSPATTFEQFAEDFTAWSGTAFGKATAKSSLEKMCEEMLEIEHALKLPVDDENRFEATATEYADALMCLLDSAARAGITSKELIKAAVKKQEVNKARKWVKNKDNTYSHLK